MENISLDEVLQDLKAIAASKPSRYAYPEWGGGRCTYVKDGEPSCLVGHYLHRKGISLDWLAAADDAPGGTGALDLVNKLIKEGALTATENIPHLLDYVQFRQDAGVPWAEAVEQAAEWARGLS